MVNNMRDLRTIAYCSALWQHVVGLRRCGDWRCLIVLVSLMSVAGVSQAKDDATAKYFEQLRERRLFSLAEGYCLSRLTDEELPLERRTQLTNELSRTLSEHARFTSGQEQAELWERSTAAIDALLKQHPQNPRKLTLQLQRALALAAQGEYLRWQVELFPYDKTSKPRAVAALDKAVMQLKSLDEQVDEQLKKTAPRRSVPDGELSPYELRSLSYRLSFQIGQTLIERAKLDSAGSPDRIAALLDAESWLGRLTKRSAEQELTLDSRLLLADSSRMRGDRKQAADVLQSIRNEKPSPEILDRATAIEARLLLDDDRADDAAQLLSRYRVERLRLPGELHFLQIRALSSLWAVADQKQETTLAAQLMEQIEAHAARAENEVGGFWAYRCRLLMETTRETKRYGVELAATVRKARSFYSAGQRAEAVTTYGNAYAEAEKSGNDNVAMEIGYTRASIQLQSQEYLDSAASFQQLAARFPGHQQAAPAHLLAAYSLGRAYEAQRTKVRRETYTAALVKHRQQFENHETAHEATWMLARLEERRLQVTRALTLYREIPTKHRRGPQAAVAVARCYEKILDRIRELGRPIDAWENDAVTHLQQTVAGYTKLDRPLSIEQTEVLLRFARICLNRSPADYQRAAALLDQIEASKIRRTREANSVDDNEAVRARRLLLHQAATQLRIVTLAGGGRFEEAKRLVETLAATNARDVLGILDGLSDLTANANQKSRRQLGELQLSAARDLNRRRDELETAQQTRLDHCLAQAYMATGRSARAIEVYQTLLSRSPKDRRLLKTVAQLLMKCGTAECLRQAKTNWRKLESLEKAGSTAWLNARYHVALCAYELKDYDECRKLLAVTQLVYPALGGERLQRQFAELERRLDKRP